ncbi:MAG TPA: helix-turn-helix transcriptional regulator [Candidatus Paceibacterota bacterium]|nr:helix-turn-helix transcriptional regulator [Candidatus Paceibacterota bacterium]
MATIVRSTSDWEAELGSRVRLVRKQRKMTQQELADRSNVSRSAIKYLEAGKGSSLATFLNVVRALELDENLDQIFAVVSTISPLALLQAKKKAGQL